MGLFSIMGRLGLDTSDFQAGIKRADSATTGFANKLSGDIKGKLAGAFTAGAVIAATKTLLDHAGKIVDLADAYRITTEQVQILMQAAAENGVEEEKLLQITTKLAEQRQKAIEGDDKAIAVFARMGVSLQRLQSAELDNFTLLKEVGAANAARTDTLQNQADLTDLLGAKSAKAAEAIRQLSTATPILIISDEELRKLDAVGDKISAITLALKSLGGLTLGAGFNIAGKDAAFTKALLLLSIGVKPDAKTMAAMVGVDLKDEVEPNFSALNGGGYDAATQAIEAARANRKPETVKTARERSASSAGKFTRPDTGNLARIGGLYFGADYNMRLMTLQQETKRLTERIAVSNDIIAQSVKE